MKYQSLKIIRPLSSYPSGRNVVIPLPLRLCMVNNTGQILIPILILVSIVGLSFAYVGTSTNSSSPTLSQSQPWLGISAVELTPQIAEATGIGETTGLLVLQVAPGGPADKAGIRGGNELKAIEGGEIPVGGDVITHIDGSAIRTLDDFRSNLSNKQIGDTVEFRLVSANGDERTTDAILEARPA